MEKQIGFICDDGRQFLVRSMVGELRDAGYDVLLYSSEANVSILSDSDLDVFIVYFDGFNVLNERTMRSFDKEIKEKNKNIHVYLIGSDDDLNQAYHFIDLAFVAHAFKRPVNMENVIRELRILAPAYTYEDSLLASKNGKDSLNGRKNILIVDDDDVYLRTIEGWFSDEYNVYTAVSGTNALALLKMVSFDLILLDYEMPMISGLDLFRVLRSEPETADIPLFFLTAKDDKQVCLEILEEKPDGYILKTTAPLLLKYNIRSFFEGKKLWWKTSEE
ncbi:MAG: response regulator [Treponema sp.]|nr:response regulator [Treponema sp.]